MSEDRQGGSAGCTEGTCAEAERQLAAEGRTWGSERLGGEDWMYQGLSQAWVKRQRGVDLWECEGQREAREGAKAAGQATGSGPLFRPGLAHFPKDPPPASPFPRGVTGTGLGLTATRPACVSEKPGLCPAFKIRDEGLPLTLCQQDSDCHKRDKCCRMGSSYVCAPPSPTAEEPSTGPATPEGHSGQRCRSDRDCPGAEMCCSHQCHAECPAQDEGKPGFCPVRNGLYFSYDCEARCQRDGDCPRDQKCCLRGCDHECLAPSEEKPGICPLTDGITSNSPWCKSSCAEDKECAGDQKCCDSGCGRTCQAPEREKPGTCPKQKPWQTLVPCNEQDACAHDRDCPRQDKCCFAGCAMRCGPHYKEHPGACPRAKACSDPRQRHSNQCLDDHVCERHEKCCDTGCRRECVAVRTESEDKSGDGPTGACVDECRADEECPRGQRCRSNGCGRVCQEVSRGVCPSPLGFGPCVDLCFADVECPRGQKCCSNGCGHVCMTAITGGRPGLCPVPQGKGICVERCREDEECPRGQKCCSNGCGHVCTSPIFADAV
nr:balbiani ring protein 3-like [Chelonoidis abingdonii]